MFRLLVEKELRDILASPKFTATFAVCSILILLSFTMGAREYKIGVQRHEAALQENVRQLEGVTDWVNVQHWRVFLPPQPLAALVTGISNDIGLTSEVRGQGEPSAEGSRFNDDPILAVFRFLDLEFLFQVLLTLFAVVFAFDAVNGEKERGTLRLALANAVPRSTFILGKIVGSLIGLLVPLLLPLLGGCALLAVLGVSLSGGEWVRLFLILLSGLLLVGGFVVFSVLVSSATRRSTSSFLVLLVVWMAVVLVAPRAAVLLAGRAVAVPTVDEIASQKSRLASQLFSEDRKAMAEFRAEGGGDMETVMAGFRKHMNEIAQERERKLEELAGRLNEERRNAQERQAKLALALARVSPPAVFSLAASRLAGTSLDLPRHYLEQVAAYQREYGRFMVEKTGLNPGGARVIMRVVRGGGDGEEEQPKPVDPAELPQFHYRPFASGEVIGKALPDMALLGAFGALFLMGAVTLFNRYDVR